MLRIVCDIRKNCKCSIAVAGGRKNHFRTMCIKNVRPVRCAMLAKLSESKQPIDNEQAMSFAYIWSYFRSCDVKFLIDNIDCLENMFPEHKHIWQPDLIIAKSMCE